MIMVKKYKDLDDVFDVEPISENTETVISVPAEPVQSSIEDVDAIKDDILKDYEYTRGNLYSIIEKGQEAINGILELAQQSDMPRAYEVAGQLIKNVADATDKLMDLQKKLKDIDETKSKGPTTVNNALYVGSTADLLKLIKEQKQSK
jgi:hypothetical protein